MGVVLKVSWLAAATLCVVATFPVQAQTVADPVDETLFSAAKASMPELSFTPAPGEEGDYDKYYVFHRDDTDIAQAWGDIRECDALASGISYRVGNGEPYPGYFATQYGIGGVVGGLVGAALADVIHGSAKRRAIRRVNMRNCMGFKGYDRYGLPKTLWETFNFEEGNGRKDDAERNLSLMQQAIAASGPKPQGKALGI